MARTYWQKAKILFDDSMPHLAGKFVWIRGGAPQLRFDAANLLMEPAFFVVTNLEPGRWGSEVGLGPKQVERYAEFSRFVGIVKRKVWTDPKWKGAHAPTGFQREGVSNSAARRTASSNRKSSRSTAGAAKSAAPRTT